MIFVEKNNLILLLQAIEKPVDVEVIA